MADVNYEVAAKFTGEDDLRRGAAAFERMGDTAQRAADDMNRSGRNAGMGWINLSSQIQVAQAALGAVSGVAREVYQTLGEGAELLLAQEKFDNLAVSIGTTADALLGKMREATSGMMSDAELIASGTDLMSLGLAKTEEDAVRLASVIGRLGWDMQQVVLTMANNSTMRLDALGLSMEDVKSRAAELREAGMSLDEAFDLAVIEAGEAKIALLGDASETAAGKIKILEASVKNAQDSFKTAFAESLVAGIDAAVDGTELLDDAIQRAATDAGTLLGNLSSAFILQFGEKSAIKQLEDLGADMAVIRDRAREIDRETGAGLIQLGTSPQDIEAVTRRYAMMVDEIERLQNIQRMINAPIDYPGPPPEAARDWRDLADALAEFNQASNQGAYTPPPDVDATYYQETYGGLYEINQALIDQEVYARRTADAWSAYTAEISARGGGFFDAFIEEADRAREAGEQWAFDVNQAIYDAMSGGGAGADILAGFADDVGHVAEDIQAALSAAQEQSIVTDLAAGVREYGIAWAELPGMVEAAIAELEGQITRIPQVAAPMEDRGFRENWQENQAFTPPEPVVVPMEIQIREDLIDAAIANARGMVEGFTNPDQVYQAVMEMDISAVESGVGAATQLINGIPTQKTITINWEQSGVDVIAALRALGII